jgi:FlaA1/EpsC-like NDP-sugar epimerase
VVIHALVFASVYLVAYVLRFEGAIPAAEWGTAIGTLPLIIVWKLVIFILMKSYRGWWRYNGFADIVHLAKAVTIGTLAVVLVASSYQAGPRVPRSVILMDWAGTLLVIGGARGATRLYRERYHPMVTARSTERVLVVGAGEAGVELVSAIQRHPQLGMKVVGILDRSSRGQVLAGVKVLGPPEDVRRHATAHRAKTVLIPIPATPPPEVRGLKAACATAGLKVQAVPGFGALVTGGLTVRPRDIDINDLLSREPVRLDDASVGNFIRGRVVLVTGAAGSIGSEICRQVLRFQPGRLVLLDHSENGLFFIERELRAVAGEAEVVPCVANITDVSRVRAMFHGYRPSVVFHAAAHKHVPLMEANPGEAVKNNVFGTRILVDEAVSAAVEAFVLISSDKAVRPSSVMGACKRLAEMYLQGLAGRVTTRLVTVRFGNVLGSNASVVPLFKEQIRRGGPVTVTDPEMTRYFMTIPEAAQLVLQAGALGHESEIFVLDMGPPVKVVDLARDLIRLSGGADGREVDIVFTGLRPGERLHEELYDLDEERVPTPHPKIFAARQPPCSREWLQDQLDQLAGVIEGPADEVITVLKEVVPRYQPCRHAALSEVG